MGMLFAPDGNRCTGDAGDFSRIGDRRYSADRKATGPQR